VVGRKNWLFSNTSAGAHTSAGLYSFIETQMTLKLGKMTIFASFKYGMILAFAKFGGLVVLSEND